MFPQTSSQIARNRGERVFAIGELLVADQCCPIGAQQIPGGAMQGVVVFVLKLVLAIVPAPQRLIGSVRKHPAFAAVHAMLAERTAEIVVIPSHNGAELRVLDRKLLA